MVRIGAIRTTDETCGFGQTWDCMQLNPMERSKCPIRLQYDQAL